MAQVGLRHLAFVLSKRAFRAEKGVFRAFHICRMLLSCNFVLRFFDRHT